MKELELLKTKTKVDGPIASAERIVPMPSKARQVHESSTPTLHHFPPFPPAAQGTVEILTNQAANTATVTNKATKSHHNDFTTRLSEGEGLDLISSINISSSSKIFNSVAPACVPGPQGACLSAIQHLVPRLHALLQSIERAEILNDQVLICVRLRIV